MNKREKKSENFAEVFATEFEKFVTSLVGLAGAKSFKEKMDQWKLLVFNFYNWLTKRAEASDKEGKTFFSKFKRIVWNAITCGIFSGEFKSVEEWEGSVIIFNRMLSKLTGDQSLWVEDETLLQLTFDGYLIRVIEKLKKEVGDKLAQ